MMTPLHAASASGHLAVIQHLLEVGADASAVDMEGNTPVHVACLNGQDVVLAAILSAPHVSTPALVNAMNKAGQTPLHFAGGLKPVCQHAVDFVVGVHDSASMSPSFCPLLLLKLPH